MTLRPAALRDKPTSVPVVQSGLSLNTGAMATAGLGLVRDVPRAGSKTSAIRRVDRDLLVEPARFETDPAMIGADAPLSPAVIVLASLALAAAADR